MHAVAWVRVLAAPGEITAVSLTRRVGLVAFRVRADHGRRMDVAHGMDWRKAAWRVLVGRRRGHALRVMPRGNVGRRACSAQAGCGLGPSERAEETAAEHVLATPHLLIR